jgi:dolichol-phosphate mannosyltransferase
MELFGRAYEVICVDDGSTDDTFSVVEGFHDANGRVKCVQFARHQGKTLAYRAGFELASHPIIVTMDADLQNGPADIPRLVAKLEEGFDLVCGWRTTRRDTLGKRVASALYNVLTSLLLGPRLHDHNCGLKSYRAEVVRHLPLGSQTHRYITSIVHLGGHKVTEIPVAHYERTWGESRYGPARLLRGFADLLVLFLALRVRRRAQPDGAARPPADKTLRSRSAKVLL